MRSRSEFQLNPATGSRGHWLISPVVSDTWRSVTVASRQSPRGFTVPSTLYTSPNRARRPDDVWKYFVHRTSTRWYERSRSEFTSPGVRDVCLASPAAQAHIDVRTGAARYRVSATFLSDHGRHASPVTIALVERLDSGPPSERELSRRFSLTPRELEVAMLLPRGLSSREIATALGISLNTARRHVERLLLKLDVRNRTAAAAKISGR